MKPGDKKITESKLSGPTLAKKSEGRAKLITQMVKLRLNVWLNISKTIKQEILQQGIKHMIDERGETKIDYALANSEKELNTGSNKTIFQI